MRAREVSLPLPVLAALLPGFGALVLALPRNRNDVKPGSGGKRGWEKRESEKSPDSEISDACHCVVRLCLHGHISNIHIASVGHGCIRGPRHSQRFPYVSDTVHPGIECSSPPGAWNWTTWRSSLLSDSHLSCSHLSISARSMTASSSWRWRSCSSRSLRSSASNLRRSDQASTRSVCSH